jgi:hypothetical protein
MSIDERRYIEAIPPQLFDEMISDYAASLPSDSHHKPTARTVKQIALQLADRQKFSPLHRQDCVNTTLEQLADYCCVKPASISDALRCLEFLGIVKTIRKGGGPLKKATVRNVNLSVFTQWGMPPFDPNKRKKQKPEHNGEFDEQHGETAEHNGDLDDQHGKHPQTLNELLNKETESARATANTNENKTEQTFEPDPYSAIDGLPNNQDLSPIDAPCPEQIAAMQQAKAMVEKMRYKN